MDSIFGPLVFDEGWYTSKVIHLFQKEYTINVCAHAYYETDNITKEQELAFEYYKEYEAQALKMAETLLDSRFGADCAVRFVPRTMLFERNGSYTLLCDDIEAPEEGIAVLLSPKQMIMSQNDYL